MLCSLAGDLEISETVDLPHMLVAMHMPKKIFVDSTQTAGEPGR
jgi:acetamidase/formamidase